MASLWLTSVYNRLDADSRLHPAAEQNTEQSKTHGNGYLLRRVLGGDLYRAELTPPRPPSPASGDAAGIRICGGRITELLAVRLFPLNEHDPDLGIVTPDRLAGSSRMTTLDENEHRGNVDRVLNLQASASLRYILNGARNWTCSDKDFP